MGDRSPELSPDLQVRLSCPQCGAAGVWSLLQVLRQCPYCTSVLWWPNDPAVRECFMVQDLAPLPQDGLDVLQTADATREHSRLRGLTEEGRGGDAEAMNRILAEALIPDIETLKRRRAPQFTLRDHRTLWVPYQMVYALLAYHALGRTRTSGAERKVFRPFLFSLDAVLPAYPEPWDFRDRGLWFARQSLLPLDEAVLGGGNVLAPSADDLDPLVAARPWLSRRQLLESDMHPIAFSARVVRAYHWWIFRPFHCLLADTPMGSGWFLVDGQFRTLAGHLKDAEAARVLARDWPPLDPHRFHRPRIRPFPGRCPVCGGALTLDEHGLQEICPNCGRLLEPTSEGFKPRPYRIMDREALPWPSPPGADRTAWVPFWRLEGRWTLGGATAPTLEAAAAAILPPGGASSAGTSGPLYLPAFEGWLYDRYDAWCLRTSESLGARGPASEERRFHLEVKVGRDDLLFPPSLEPGVYEAQMDGLGPALLPPAIQARLNPVMVKRLQEARFTIESRDLVFVPVPLGRFGDLPDRLLGPGVAVDAGPLASGVFPPILYRNVRRWKGRAEASRARKATDTDSIFSRPIR